MNCPACGAGWSRVRIEREVEEAALSACEGGDSWNGGDVETACPHCGEECIIAAEGYTERVPTIMVTKLEARRA